MLSGDWEEKQAMLRTVNAAPFDEEGYASVAALGNTGAMALYIRRLVADGLGQVLRPERLVPFARWHSGERMVQTLEVLKDELRREDWVSLDPVAAAEQRGWSGAAPSARGRRQSHQERERARPGPLTRSKELKNFKPGSGWFRFGRSDRHRKPDLLRELRRADPRDGARLREAVERLVSGRHMGGLREYGLVASAFSRAASWEAALRANVWATAVQLLAEVRNSGIRMSTSVRNAVLSACHPAAECAWRTAVGLARSQAHYPPADVQTYSAAATALEKVGQWAGPLSLLDEARAGGLQPSLIMLSAVASACEKGGRWERSLGLLRSAGAAGCEPDVIMHNAVISACGRGKEWQATLELLRGMQFEKVSPDRHSVDCTVQACHGVAARKAFEIASSFRRGPAAPRWAGLKEAASVRGRA
ncbi:unnamed protein product [Prorocentrum cordatum]|uniref:Uncharacterized protein n=1 Tax=Prorocentrum cordatum TaxID=2364126 RepID=A0ABN9T6Z8_9DINO|nr:unnamed protein product [Polarella glacialis]